MFIFSENISEVYSIKVSKSFSPFSYQKFWPYTSNTFTFQTNYIGNNFNPYIISPDTAIWNFYDGTNFSVSNSPVHTFLNNNIKNVSFYLPNLSSVSDFYANNLNIYGIIDFSSLNEIKDINVNDNIQLGQILFSSQTINSLSASNCNFANVSLYSLNQIYEAYIQNNKNLTSVTLPNIFHTLYAYNCSIPYVNFSSLSGNNNDVYIYLQNNRMISPNINEILAELDGNSWSGGTLYINGNNNCIDSYSNGYDGITAFNNLTAKSWSVYVSMPEDGIDLGISNIEFDYYHDFGKTDVVQEQYYFSYLN